jgi:CheY-like chemotaxis protein
VTAQHAAPKHVLVINDTEEIVELFRDILTGMGHDVSATTFAPEDLEEVTKVGPDLVIVDLLFGREESGWQLLQKMRMSRDTEDIPVILCTAATKEAREQEGWLVANGIKLVLKPFAIDDLELAVTKALDLPKLITRTDTRATASEDGDRARRSNGDSRSHSEAPN